MSEADALTDELLANAGWVRALARRLAGDEQRGEELAQRAWLLALERRPRVGETLRPWLAGVLARLSRHEERAAARALARERAAARPERDPRDAATLVAELDLQRWLAERVRELPEPYRELILRRHFRGEEVAQIAAATGRSPATVRSQLARAHARLRQAVEARARAERRSALSILFLACGEAGWPAAATTATVAMKTKTLLALALVALVSSLAVLRVAGIGPFASEAAAPPLALPVAPPEEQREELEPARSQGASERAAAAAPAPELERAAPAAEAGTHIALRAVDEHRAPVAGATLALVRRDGSPGALAPSAASDADGALALELPASELRSWRGQLVRLFFALRAPDRATRFLEVVPERDATVDLGELELRPGGALAGRVVDERGAPVAGARVIGVAGALVVAPDEARRGGPDRERCHVQTTTDARGAFELAGLAAAEARLFAHAPGFAWALGDPQRVEAGRTLGGIELVLAAPPAEMVLRGRVLDSAGAPAAGAAVHFAGREEGRVDADEAGRFEQVVAGSTSLRVRALDPEGRSGPSATRDWRPGAGELELRLTPRRELALTVTDEDGAPLEAAWAIATTGQLIDPGGDFVRSDASGRIHLVLPPARFRLSVGKRGFVDRRFERMEPEATPPELEVALERERSVRGIVLAGGEPVAGARVAAYQDPHGEFVERTRGFPQRLYLGNTQPVESDSEGRFEVPLEESRWQHVLLVSAPGLAATELPVPPDAPEREEPLEVELRLGGAIAGRVLVAGEPAQGVVVAISRGDHEGRAMRSDDEGRYRFEHLTPGPWRVETRATEPAMDVLAIAQTEAQQDFRWNCEVFEGRTTEHDLLLETLEDTRLDGRFLVDGAPAAGWTARLVKSGFERSALPLAATTVGEAGAFELAAPAGAYDLELRSPAGSTAELVVLRPVELEGEVVLWGGELTTATLAGTAEPGARLRLVRGRYDEGERELATFSAGADGRFEVAGLPAGRASLQHEKEGSYGLGWYTIRQVELPAGARIELD